MPSLTLSDSSLRAHSFKPCPKPRMKPFPACCFLSANSVYKKHYCSKLPFRYPCLVLFRNSRQWCENTFDEAFGRLLPRVSVNWSGIRRQVLEQEISGDSSFEVCQKTAEPVPIMDGICVSHESPAKNGSIQEFQLLPSVSSHGGLLKFVLFLGYLSLQGSQPAVAGTDIASGLQSIPLLGDLGDISTGFASAFLLIFFSELGDKTFFIAALLAARNSAAIVFTGTFGALAAMTIISVVLGRTFHYVDEILPFRLGGTDLPLDDIAAVCLLVYFGVSTLIDASSSDGLKAQEEQREAELAVSKFSGNGAGIIAAANTIMSTFLLVFLAEWGDKSFFSTIALAAASSPLGVIGGSLAGHGAATLIAVLGGSLLGTFLSEKVTAYIGGVLFLVFAAVTLVEIVS